MSLRAALAGLVSAIAVLAPAPLLAQAPDKEEPAVICQDEATPPPARIAACSKIIDDTARPAPERAEALITRGALHDDAERPDAAIKDLTAALAIAPNDATALLLRGNVYYAKGDLDAALADYSAGIAASPEDAAGYFNRAIVHEAKGDKAKAVADYRKALEIDPAFEEAKAALDELEGK